MEYLIWTAIAVAAVLVIIKKVRDFRKGKLCSCGCENCPSKCKKDSEKVNA